MPPSYRLNFWFYDRYIMGKENFKKEDVSVLWVGFRLCVDAHANGELEANKVFERGC